jgi:hypothetical protein
MKVSIKFLLFLFTVATNIIEDFLKRKTILKFQFMPVFFYLYSPHR